MVVCISSERGVQRIKGVRYLGICTSSGRRGERRAAFTAVLCILIIPFVGFGSIVACLERRNLVCILLIPSRSLESIIPFTDQI